MEENRLESDLADAEPPLRVVVAYRDLAACHRAMRLLADVGEALGDDIDFQPLPWSFDLLADFRVPQGSIHRSTMNTLWTPQDSATTLSARVETPALPSATPARRLTAVEPRARILYVDDEPQLRRLGALVLAQSGYEVDTAADGAEGWEALQHAQYNLLITDHDMPRLTGLELATQARLAGMRLPIVLTSGSVTVLRDSSVEWLDIAACLPKPFRADTLMATVERTLRAANNLRQCSGAMMDILKRLAEIRPYRHGGINE